MARRSPLNARYQKNTQPAGKTRRSASAARPKRSAGEQGSAPAKKKAKGSRPSLREAWASQPTSPEMKKWRRVWWVAIGSALAVALVIAFVPFVKSNRTLVMVLSVVYLIALGGAFYIDLGIIRKLRAQLTSEAKAARKK